MLSFSTTAPRVDILVYMVCAKVLSRFHALLALDSTYARRFRTIFHKVFLDLEKTQRMQIHQAFYFSDTYIFKLYMSLLSL